ncbi:DUF305 domain-containing protein [Sphingobacterium oryzagri]|uniref:DUF305 domain-containing protein n=1 Tax=Sphingobacterium oryzagri TaxID=3025669 RepID=A0ABY7WCE4_9SPHI|nr:DUF305 domain-containing protein [Sphingobacterium sp. KACC 22765]WDF67130.1 DUF305 domain-containing protein [Sphingobacterium sp. KACC 22765]
MKNMQNSHNPGHASEHGPHNSKHNSGMYKRFAVMAVAMFAAMYFIMYAMIDGWQNLIPNINNLYMTLLMTSAMLLIELLIMKVMYANRKMNWVIAIISVAIGIFSWFGIREQINVGDKQFVKGMIPHHAAAILMSEKAHLTDPELLELQKNILETQEEEIELMKRKLKEFEYNK